MKNINSIIFTLSLSVSLFAAPQIPSIPWEVRSDWMDVKTPHTWNNVKAVGDGVADDTAALQCALAAVPHEGGTVYLPPGRYRITETLFYGTYQLDSTTRPRGFSIIGCGRDTTIVWDGPADQPMLRLTGILQSRIIGVQFDAAEKASSCIDMGGPGFQSHNLFRHCAFMNARQAAIMTSRVKINTSCTEHRIENCLFENSGIGIFLSHFNDYDCVISGCEFRDCGIAVRTNKGNFYARDCHFERSKTADFQTFCEHTPSIRRCTSYGSAHFLLQENPHCATVVQDCHIGGFTSPDGAILQNVVPALIFDTSIKPADSNVNAPAVAFRHTDTEKLVGGNMLNPDFKLVSANNVFAGGMKNAQRVFDFSNASQYPVSGLTPRTSFLKTEVAHAVRTDKPYVAVIPGKIFDVKRDYGAKGGEADDTAAFQAAITAAKAHGHGAMVYIPHGHYTVRQTLELDGEDWYFGGSGLGTTLSWYGEEGHALLHVNSPKSLGIIDLQFMRMGGRRDGKDVLHTGGAEDSYTLYDNVRGHGWLVAEPDVRGLHFENLGPHDVVHSIATYGNMVFKNCAAATILIDSHYEGTMHVKGENPNRNGITAFQFALLEICNPCIWVEDNNSLVMTDFYNEQCITLYRIMGNAALPSGRISLGSIKVENRPRIVDGYHGQITLLYPQYYNNNLNGVATWQTQNGASVDYLEVASYYYQHSLEWPQDGSFRACFLATGGSPAKTETVEHFFHTHADASVDEIRAQIQATLEDFRRVGLLDLQLNHPGLK
ncbi:MAG: right-handed parallel beta-helix repeat-containing protein [Victivallales bacterium]|nr:right-handed parallel beta-helix repeat-containing protein [Victivallales bacterium]